VPSASPRGSTNVADPAIARADAEIGATTMAIAATAAATQRLRARQELRLLESGIVSLCLVERTRVGRASQGGVWPDSVR
jgi:hypothetical protein